MKYPELVAPDAAGIRDAILNDMRENDPIYWCDHEAIQAWIITSYDDVFSFFKDDRLEFGSTKAEILKQSKEEQEGLEHLVTYMDLLMSALPRERHRAIQKIMMDFLSMSTLKEFNKDIRYIINKIINDIEGCGRVNMVQKFSYPIPANVIATIMGIPEKDWQHFIDWSAPIEAIFWPYNYEKYKKAGDCLEAMMAYFKELMPAAARRGDDTLLAKYGEAVSKGVVTEDEALLNCAAAMFAGHETTATVINAGIQMLFEEPGLLSTLKSDPSKISNAAAEILRYRPAIGWMRRTAMETFEYKGKKIKQGDVIYLGTYAANRDPKYFKDPNKFDINREIKNPIMTFGIGQHYCLGAALGKMEIELALAMLIERFPNMSLDPSDTTHSPTMMLMNNITDLPLNLE